MRKQKSDNSRSPSVEKVQDKAASKRARVQDKATETQSHDRDPTELALINQLLSAIVSEDPEKMKEQMRSALALREGIEARNAIESMLAVQMVATHQAAMQCLHLGQTNNLSHAFDLHLRHSEKLLSLYTRQVEILNKLRGGGQQQVTVRYVQVQAGGQAVVGNVQTPTLNPGRQAPKNAPAALTDQSGTAMPMVNETAKRPAKLSRKG